MDKLEKDLQQVARRCVAHTAIVMRYTIASDVNKAGDVYLVKGGAGVVCVLPRVGKEQIIFDYFEEQLLALGYVVTVNAENQQLVVSDERNKDNVDPIVKKSVNVGSKGRINTRNRSNTGRG